MAVEQSPPTDSQARAQGEEQDPTSGDAATAPEPAPVSEQDPAPVADSDPAPVAAQEPNPVADQDPATVAEPASVAEQEPAPVAAQEPTPNPEIPDLAPPPGVHLGPPPLKRPGATPPPPSAQERLSAQSNLLPPPPGVHIKKVERHYPEWREAAARTREEIVEPARAQSMSLVEEAAQRREAALERSQASQMEFAAASAALAEQVPAINSEAEAPVQTPSAASIQPTGTNSPPPGLPPKHQQKRRKVQVQLGTHLNPPPSSKLRPVLFAAAGLAALAALSWWQLGPHGEGDAPGTTKRASVISPASDS